MASRGRGKARRSEFLHPDELPIPVGSPVTSQWTGQMIELAEYIGAYATLLVVDRFGGEYVYIPSEARLNPFRRLIGDERSELLSRVYGRERIRIPTGKAAVRQARRGGVIAAVRAGFLSNSDAARCLRTSLTYATHLVHHTQEGHGVEPVDSIVASDDEQMDLAARLVADELAAEGVDDRIIERVVAGLHQLD